MVTKTLLIDVYDLQKLEDKDHKPIESLNISLSSDEMTLEKILTEITNSMVIAKYFRKKKNSFDLVNIVDVDGIEINDDVVNLAQSGSTVQVWIEPEMSPEEKDAWYASTFDAIVKKQRDDAPLSRMFAEMTLQTTVTEQEFLNTKMFDCEDITTKIRELNIKFAKPPACNSPLSKQLTERLYQQTTMLALKEQSQLVKELLIISYLTTAQEELQAPTLALINNSLQIFSNSSITAVNIQTEAKKSSKATVKLFATAAKVVTEGNAEEAKQDALKALRDLANSAEKIAKKARDQQKGFHKLLLECVNLAEKVTLERAKKNKRVTNLTLKEIEHTSSMQVISSIISGYETEKKQQEDILAKAKDILAEQNRNQNRFKLLSLTAQTVTTIASSFTSLLLPYTQVISTMKDLNNLKESMLESTNAAIKIKSDIEKLTKKTNEEITQKETKADNEIIKIETEINGIIADIEKPKTPIEEEIKNNAETIKCNINNMKGVKDTSKIRSFLDSTQITLTSIKRKMETLDTLKRGKINTRINHLSGALAELTSDTTALSKLIMKKENLAKQLAVSGELQSQAVNTYAKLMENTINQSKAEVILLEQEVNKIKQSEDGKRKDLSEEIAKVKRIALGEVKGDLSIEMLTVTMKALVSINKTYTEISHIWALIAATSEILGQDNLSKQLEKIELDAPTRDIALEFYYTINQWLAIANAMGKYKDFVWSLAMEMKSELQRSIRFPNEEKARAVKLLTETELKVYDIFTTTGKNIMNLLEKQAQLESEVRINQKAFDDFVRRW